MTKFHFQDQSVELEYQSKGPNFELKLNNHTYTGQIQEIEPGYYLLQAAGQNHPLYVFREHNHYQVFYQGEVYHLEEQRKRAEGHEEPSSNQIGAPLTGKILQVAVVPGQVVEKGDTLVIMESMKMETALTAPFGTVVDKVLCQEGEQAALGQLLIELAPLAAE